MKNNKRGFTLNRHAEKFLLSIPTTTNNTQGRDPEQKLLRMALCKGFTLIELLIVVLIIGILSAIAVPQYQKAVLKSRFSSLMPTTKSIRDGNEIYYMTNGRYADAVSKLDVTAANTEDMTLTVSDDMDYAYTLATRPSLKNNLIMYQKHSANFPGEIHCEALDGNTLANWVCETGLHGTPLTTGSVTEGYNTYILEGAGSGLFSGADDNTLSCDKAESMGLTCSITENAQGQTVKQVCQNNFCRTKTFNEDGSYTSVTCQANSNGVCVSNGWESNWYSVTYDANGNKLTQRYCRSNGVDSNGNCTKYNSSYAENYTYDANGNMLTSRRCSSLDNSGNCTAYSASAAYDYTYDANGNMLTQRYCSSVDPSSGNCTAYQSSDNYDYTYDANGNMLTQRKCVSVDGSSGNCTEYSNNYYDALNYTYDANGNMLTKRTCRSVDTSNGNCLAYSSNSAYNYTYDANGNMLTLRNCSTVDNNGNCTAYTVSTSYNYTYDTDGNQLTKRSCDSVDTNGNCTPSSGGYIYTYDANGNQLTGRYCSSLDNSGNCTAYSASAAYDYTYDANGNKTSERNCKTVDTSSGNCTEYYNTARQEYTYDANGNQLTQQYCNSVDSSSGDCLAYANRTDFIYDDNGKIIAQPACSGSNFNTSTGECTAYNNTYIKPN